MDWVGGWVALTFPNRPTHSYRVGWHAERTERRSRFPRRIRGWVGGWIEDAVNGWVGGLFRWVEEKEGGWVCGLKTLCCFV